MDALGSNGIPCEGLSNRASLVAHRKSLPHRLQPPPAYPPHLPLLISTPCPSAVRPRLRCNLVVCRPSMLRVAIRSVKRWCNGSRCTSVMFAVSRRKGFGERLSCPSFVLFLPNSSQLNISHMQTYLANYWMDGYTDFIHFLYCIFSRIDRSCMLTAKLWSQIITTCLFLLHLHVICRFLIASHVQHMA